MYSNLTFRFIAWQQPTPPTPTQETEKRFPWVLYARQLRNHGL